MPKVSVSPTTSTLSRLKSLLAWSSCELNEEASQSKDETDLFEQKIAWRIINLGVIRSDWKSLIGLLLFSLFGTLVNVGFKNDTGLVRLSRHKYQYLKLWQISYECKFDYVSEDLGECLEWFIFCCCKFIQSGRKICLVRKAHSVA
jgi:hypothetical protein